MDEYILLAALGIGMLFIVVFAIVYLNSVRDDSSSRLVKMLDPFEVSFSTFKKATFASGTFDGIRGTINLTPESKGRYLVKMRMRLDVPGLPVFSLSTERTSIFLRKYANEHTERWPRVGEGYFVKTESADLPSEAVTQALSSATLDHIDAFERQYEGILLYKADGTLFKRLDIDLLRAVPELRNQHLLMTHFYLQTKRGAEVFQAFVRDSAKLAKELQKDFASLADAPAPVTDEKRRLTIKDNSPL